MAFWTGMSFGARAAVIAAGAGVVAVVVAVLFPPVPKDVAPVAVSSDAPAPAPAPATPEPVVAAAPAPEPALPEPAAVSEVAKAAPPVFDTYRITAEGDATVSGRAEPMAQVSVLVDGVGVAGVKALGDGSFAALFTLPPSDKPSLMTLEAVLADGSRIGSEQSVAIAPIAGPVTVATVEPAIDAAEPETVAAEAAIPPVALLVTDEGATVLQSPAEVVAVAPDAAAPVLLDAISYAPDGAVLLSGRGQAGQAVRIYLDNAAVADAPVAAGGNWQVTLGDTAPGIYTLRVDQIAADGTVSARFETPFKRETQEALAALSATPAPEAPADTTAAQPAPEPEQVASVEPADDAATVAAVAVVDEPASAEAPFAEAAAVADVAPPAAPEAGPDTQAPAVETSSAPPAETGAPEAAPVVVAQSAPEPVPEPSEPAPNLIASTAPEAVTADTPAADRQPVSITVQPGFTLWGIARQSLGDGVMYVQVYEANREKIRNPDLIYPGQVFTIPAKP